MLPTTKRLREALAESGLSGSLLDDAYSEIYALEAYIRKNELLYPEYWCFCGPEECGKLAHFAKSINCDFGYKASWGHAWIAISIPDPYRPEFAFHVARKDPKSGALMGFDRLMERIHEHMRHF